MGAPVPLAGLGRPARPVGHARPAGSHLRADRSMIYAQAEAAKVSGRLAGTLPAAPFLSLLWAAFPLLPRPWQRLIRAGNPPSSPPSRFSREVQLSAWGALQPGPCRHPQCDPRSGTAGTPGPLVSTERNKEAPKRVCSASPTPGALPVTERCQGRGRRNLRNPLSQPTPTPCEPKL